MKGNNRFVYILLVVCLLVAMMPISTVAADNAPEEVPVDFVLVLDCSGTMDKNDPEKLALTACKTFVDSLPMDNARIAVVAIGYTDKGYYEFSENYDIEQILDNKKVHNIVPLAAADDDAERANFKNAITKVGQRRNKQTWTPIAYGLAAAVDILDRNNAADDNACIILLSDGVITHEDANESDRLLDQSISTAKEHKWPMYCIELDYRGINSKRQGEGAFADDLLDRICQESGAGADGRWSVKDPGGVDDAFSKIFGKFMQTEPIILDLVNGEATFNVHELAPEVTIKVRGGDAKQLKLVYQGNHKEEYVITGSQNFGNKVKAIHEPGYYYSVKMILPTAGEWKLVADGVDDEKISVTVTPIYEAELKLEAEPSREGVLQRDDTIKFDAYFSYREQSMTPRKFYTETSAKLEVYYGSSGANPDKVFDMVGTEYGYQCEMKVGDVPSDKFTTRVVVKHEKFRNGQQESNTQSFESANLGVVAIGNDPIVLEGYINNRLDKLDLNEYFRNPDGDEINYELVHREIDFDFEIDDNNFMTINAGLIPGVHEVELVANDVRASDKGMEAPATHHLTLTVVDRPIEKERIKTIKVFTDRYGFQKDAPAEVALDLNEYFTDPDGVEMKYTVQASDTQFISVKQEGAALYLTALSDGETILTVTANDQVSDLSCEVDVISKSGKAEFWAKNWIWFALTGGLIVLIIIIIIFISKNTKVKGTWDISFEEFGNEAVAEFVSIGVLSVGRKKVFKLKALVDEVSRFVDDPTGVMAHVPNYFMDKDACAIELKGVPFGKGFIVQKIPANSTSVTVEYMGKKVVKNARITTGYITVRLIAPGAYGADEELNITMQSK